jgi:hypothetical protein
MKESADLKMSCGVIVGFYFGVAGRDNRILLLLPRAAGEAVRERTVAGAGIFGYCTNDGRCAARGARIFWVLLC